MEFVGRLQLIKNWFLEHFASFFTLKLLKSLEMVSLSRKQLVHKLCFSLFFALRFDGKGI